MTPFSVCVHFGTSETLKNHCFSQRTGLLFVVFSLSFFSLTMPSHIHILCPFHDISCWVFILLLSAAMFSWVLNVTSRKQKLFKHFLCWCCIQGLVAVVCFPWALPLDFASLRNSCPEEGQLSFPLTGGATQLIQQEKKLICD